MMGRPLNLPGLMESRRGTQGAAQCFPVALPAYVVVVSIEGQGQICYLVA